MLLLHYFQRLSQNKFNFVCFFGVILKKKDGFRNDPNLGDINVIYEDTRAWLYIYI
jgi:hypothetical protein